LLTITGHDWTKKYPEWFLETCIGWAGDGERLRSLTEEQLASLCPYTAAAADIEFSKHRTSEFVPIPDKFMIGQIIAQYVIDKKSLENQSADIQQRLNEETRRASLAIKQYPAQKILREHSKARTTTSASHSSSRARSTQNSDVQSVSSFSPSSWTAPEAGINNSDATGPMMKPAHMSDELYVSGGSSGPPHTPNMLDSTLATTSVIS
jgi:hypothetical protein